MPADAHAGQGIYYGATQGFWAVDCGLPGQYGLSNATYALSAFPCYTCPDGMTTSKVWPESAQYYVEYLPGRGGFTSMKACVTPPGYQIMGRSASRCPVGTWSAVGE